MYRVREESLLREPDSTVVARREFVCIVRKKEISQCQHRRRRRHALSQSYVSPAQA
jgi:hypothetical protein